MANIQELEERITKVESRNKEKESDKAWETSFFRKVAIALLTYLIIGLYIQAIGVSSPWINALVPSIGFVLSTLTLSFFKKLWIKYVYKD